MGLSLGSCEGGMGVEFDHRVLLQFVLYQHQGLQMNQLVVQFEVISGVGAAWHFEAHSEVEAEIALRNLPRASGPFPLIFVAHYSSAMICQRNALVLLHSFLPENQVDRTLVVQSLFPIKPFASLLIQLHNVVDVSLPHIDLKIYEGLHVFDVDDELHGTPVFLQLTLQRAVVVVLLLFEEKTLAVIRVVWDFGEAAVVINVLGGVVSPLLGLIVIDVEEIGGRVVQVGISHVNEVLGGEEGIMLELLEAKALEGDPQERGKRLNVHDGIGRIRDPPNLEFSLLGEKLILLEDFLLLLGGNGVVLVEGRVEVVLPVEVDGEKEEDDCLQDPFNFLKLGKHY